MGILSALPNIGKAVEEQLSQAGIQTPEDLKIAGAEQAWLKIQEIDRSACIHRLLALEGAIQGIKKTLLPETRKAELREFYQHHKRSRKPPQGIPCGGFLSRHDSFPINVVCYSY